MESDQGYEILVTVQNPDDFLSWQPEKKIDFYEKAVQWHDQMSRLIEQGNVSKAWGAQKLPGRVNPIATKILLITLYRVPSLDAFSELITDDPLWNHGLYWAPLLKSIEADYETDLARYNRQRSYLEAKLGKKLPKPMLKYPFDIPKVKKGGKLEFMVRSGNTPGFHDLSDEQKLTIFEKVMQMQDYHNRLREAGVLVNDWGSYQNCGFDVLPKPTNALGVTIFKVNSYDEFDDVFTASPVRDISLVTTLVLISFDESRKRTVQEFAKAKSRLS